MTVFIASSYLIYATTIKICVGVGAFYKRDEVLEIKTIILGNKKDFTEVNELIGNKFYD